MNTDKLGTAMRFIFREKGLADTEQLGQIDRIFYGKDQADLDLQIRYYCFKRGIWRAYNLELLQGEADGPESETTSKEKTSEETKAKE